MKNIFLILWLTIPIFAIQVKMGTLYTSWPASDSTLNGMIEITSDAVSSPNRLPIQVIYLVDVSRECAGSVRQGLIEGGKELLASLRDDDRFGIVIYSKYSRTLMPLTNLTAESRAQAIDQLERITTEEGRDLSAALNRVAGEFKLRAREKIEGRYLVATALAPITEGKKRRGLVAEWNLSVDTDSMGCVLHTVNYGETFNEENAIRGAELGGGRAYLVSKDRPDSLVTVFKELGSAITSPVYRNLELFVEIPEGGAKFCALGTDKPLVNPIKIKQIARGKTERIMFTLKGTQNQPNSVIDLDLDYYDIATNTQLNAKDNLKISTQKESVYNTEFAGTLLRGQLLAHLADNIEIFGRLDSEMDQKAAKDFRRNYAVSFQQQVVNRLETVQSSVGTEEMKSTVKLMQSIFEEIRDGILSADHIIRRVKFDLHQTLHGR